MISVSADNVLQYKNVGGYLMLKLYGEDVSVSSITLKGNSGEKLAGKATVTMPLDGVPSVVMAEDATDQITLVCDTPVALGATAEESKDFWLVVPPVTFSKGFTVTVSGNGGVFEKPTEKTVTIERNKLSKMAPIEVELSQPGNIIYYTSSDGSVVTPNDPDAFGSSILSNDYAEGLGVITFDGDVTSLWDYAFNGCESLTSITLPSGLTSIGDFAFRYCTSLTSITLPSGLTHIGTHAFRYCTSLTNIIIPDSVTSINPGAFAGCSSLVSFAGKYASQDGLFLIHSTGALIAVAFGAIDGEVTIPEGVTSIGSRAFQDCTSLTSITMPDSVTSIEVAAFRGCTSLTSITIPDSVTSIGKGAFQDCTSLTSITIKPEVPPTVGWNMFFNTNNALLIYVPSGSVEAYKSAQYWSDYADRIQAIPSSSVPVPEAVDLDLPSGLKWASFNLGATKPEEFGDYYAWGETEPYYSSLDLITWNVVWKDGKVDGYSWTSYKWFKENSLTKYCTNSDDGYNGFTDDKAVLDPEDDAAHVNLGDNWRMPTDEEWTELRENCSWEWITRNGVTGHLVSANNGNSIFLPAAGEFWDTSLVNKGDSGQFWSSSLDTASSGYAWSVSVDSVSFNRYRLNRCYGLSIRAVCE